MNDAVSEQLPSLRSRRKRSEMRQILLEAGTELLLRDGLAVGAEHITFKRVFDHVEATRGIRITNASVIGRIWRDQADYQLALLSQVTEDDGVELAKTVDAVLPLVELGDLSSLAGRRAALREICRVGGAANLDVLAASDYWPIWIGLWSHTASRPRDEEQSDLDRSLLSSYELLAEDFEAVYAAVLAHFGFRLREPMTIAQFAGAVAALIEGCAIRDRIDPELVRGIELPTGPDGERQEWTLFGIGLDGLFEHFCEPIPRWRPPIS